jgi:type IX secretion system substrate protein
LKKYPLTSKTTAMKKIILVLVASVCSFQLWSQGTLQLTAGSNIKTTGNAFLVVDNMHIVNDGTLQQTKDNGIVKLTGSVNVNLSGSSATTLNQLVMAKSGSASLNLLTNLSIVSGVSFSGGLLNLNNSSLDLGTTGVFVGESEASRAFTSGTGFVQATRTLNNPSSANPGNLGAAITSTTNLGSTIVRRGHKVQTGISGSNSSIARYFDIMPANNLALKATLRFYYFDAELNGIAEVTSYQWRTINLVNWDFMGALSRDVSANYVEWKTYTRFDRVTLATAVAPTISCPANQTVSANMNGCKASVSFAATATGTPAPSITYRIGNTVITSPNVFSKGTTTVTATASNGVAPDASCAFTVTVVCGGGPVTIASGNKTEQVGTDKLVVSASPNPSAQFFTLDVKSAASRPVTIRVVDVLGRVVSMHSNVAPNSTLHIGQQYMPGVYFVLATQGNQVVRLKLVKQAH